MFSLWFCKPGNYRAFLIALPDLRELNVFVCVDEAGQWASLQFFLYRATMDVTCYYMNRCQL